MTTASSTAAPRTGQIIAAFSMVMAGNGLLLTALGVRATRAGFSDSMTGAVLGAYYIGFLVGARHSRHLVRRFGLTQSLVVLTLAMTFIDAGPALSDDPRWWILLRVLQGYAISAAYVVMETCLNGVIANEHRGRLLGIYMVASMGAFAAGSFLFSFTGADGATPFVVAGVITSLGAFGLHGAHDGFAVAPVADAVAMPLRELFHLAPVGIAAAAVVGFANGSFTSIAVYAERADLSDTKTALVSATVGAGPIAVLFPLSVLSDRVSRRVVFAGAATMATLLCVLLTVLHPAGLPMLMALVVVGGITIALYTLASAETNDHVAPGQMAAASGQIVLLYGIGALLGPFVASSAMRHLGPIGFFWIGAGAHAAAALTVGAAHLKPTRTSHDLVDAAS